MVVLGSPRVALSGERRIDAAAALQVLLLHGLAGLFLLNGNQNFFFFSLSIDTLLILLVVVNLKDFVTLVS